MVSRYGVHKPPMYMLHFWLGFAVLFLVGIALSVLLLLPLKWVCIGLAFIASCYAVGRTIMEGFTW